MRRRVIKGAISRRPPPISQDYTVEVLGRRYAVTDMVRASTIVGTIIGQTGYGASQIGSQFPIRAGELLIGYVSYNGKVWHGNPDNWERNICVYDPYAADRVPPVQPARVVRNNPRISCVGRPAWGMR